MEEFNKIDNFLAKWSSGDLTEIEKESFSKTKEYKLYTAILKGTDRLDIPLYDTEKNFQAVQNKMKKGGPVVRLLPIWTYAVAASIALLIGYVSFFNQSISYETQYGKKLTITLPDNSEVILNAKSKLEYQEKNWETERTLLLEGEAFFKVSKGSIFTVDSDNGKITVLGTQFAINSEGNIFEVVCYEGKVRVEKNGLQKIITKGQAVRAVNGIFENWSSKQENPSWLQDESTFYNAPLNQVLTALKKQYSITINPDNVDRGQRYTGSFTHKNMETALRTVFESLDIKFVFKDNKTINLVQE